MALDGYNILCLLIMAGDVSIFIHTSQPPKPIEGPEPTRREVALNPEVLCDGILVLHLTAVSRGLAGNKREERLG